MWVRSPLRVLIYYIFVRSVGRAMDYSATSTRLVRPPRVVFWWVGFLGCGWWLGGADFWLGLGEVSSSRMRSRTSNCFHKSLWKLLGTKLRKHWVSTREKGDHAFPNTSEFTCNKFSRLIKPATCIRHSNASECRQWMVAMVCQ